MRKLILWSKKCPLYPAVLPVVILAIFLQQHEVRGFTWGEKCSMKWEVFNGQVFSSAIEQFNCSLSFGRSGNPNQSQGLAVLCGLSQANPEQDGEFHQARQQRAEKGWKQQNWNLMCQIAQVSLLKDLSATEKITPMWQVWDSDFQWHREIFLNFIKWNTGVLGILHFCIPWIIVFLHTYIL